MPEVGTGANPSNDFQSNDVCLTVPGQIQEAVRGGIKAETNATLSDFRAFKSEDYEQVWMVGAALDGPGLDGAVAVWATNKFRDAEYTGLVFSANGLAKEFSDYGDRGGEISPTDQGVDEAVDCVENAR